MRAPGNPHEEGRIVYGLERPVWFSGNAEGDFKWAHEPVFPSEFADKLNSDEYKEFPAKREVLFLEGRLGRQNFYNGNPVILDRYLWSGMAYAKAFSPSIYPFCQELYQNYRIFKKPGVEPDDIHA